VTLLSPSKSELFSGLAVRADFVPIRAFISSSTRFPFSDTVEQSRGSAIPRIDFDKPFGEEGGRDGEISVRQPHRADRPKGGGKSNSILERRSTKPQPRHLTVGTVNEDGWPNTAPRSFFFLSDEKTIVAGMVRASQTATNIPGRGSSSKWCSEEMSSSEFTGRKPC